MAFRGAAFQGYHTLGSSGLLIALGALTTVALLILPLRSCIGANAPLWWSLVMIAVASLSAGDRTALRPEVFDWVFLSAWLGMMQYARRSYATSQAGDKLDFKLIAMTALTAAIWCNLHNCFLLGLAIIACYAAAFLLEDWRTANKVSSTTKSSLACLGLGAAATLLNPYGAGLWTYLPAIVKTPFNATDAEMQPLALRELLSAHYLPFLLLLLLTFGTIASEIWRHRSKIQPIIFAPFSLSSLILVTAVTLASFTSRRYCSLASIILFFESLSFITSRSAVKNKQWSPFWHSRRSYLIVDGTMLLLVALGVWLSSSVVKVTLPMTRRDFTPPLKAVNYLATHHDGKRIFAPLVYGSILDWYVRSPAPSVFADSRLYEYNQEIFEEYFRIDRQPDLAHTVFDKYDIDWLFLANRTGLAELIKRSSDWKIEYQDEVAIIFKRTSTRTKHR